MKKRILSMVLVFVLCSLFVTVCAGAESEIVLSPSQGETISIQPEYFKAEASCEAIVFYLDGEKLGTADAEGMIEAPALTFGKHKLKAVCFFSDGSVQKTESEFTFAKEVMIKSFLQNFDKLVREETPVDRSVLDGSGFAFWQAANGNLYVVNGRSGEDGDSAIKAEVKPDTVLTSSYPQLVCLDFLDFTTGITNIEFDIKLNSTDADDLRLTNLYLWSGKIVLVSGKKWQGITQKSTTTDWAHVKLTVDTENEKVSFSLDGEFLADNADWGESTSYKNQQITFGILQNTAKSEGAPHAGITLDNFLAENKKIYMPAEADITSGELIITVPDGVSDKLTKDDIALKTANGEDVEVEDIAVSSDGKEITVSADLPAGREIVATLSGNVKYADGASLERDNVMRVETPDSIVKTDASFTLDGNALYTAEQIIGGETVSANVNCENVGSNDADVVYVLTARKAGKLIGISVKTGTVALGESGSFTPSFTLPEDAAGCEIYLMVCDSFTKAFAIGKYIKLN